MVVCSGAAACLKGLMDCASSSDWLAQQSRLGSGQAARRAGVSEAQMGAQLRRSVQPISCSSASKQPAAWLKPYRLRLRHGDPTSLHVTRQAVDTPPLLGFARSRSPASQLRTTFPFWPSMRLHCAHQPIPSCPFRPSPHSLHRTATARSGSSRGGSLITASTASAGAQASIIGSSPLRPWSTVARRAVGARPVENGRSGCVAPTLFMTLNFRPCC